MKALLGGHDVWEVIEKVYNELEYEAFLTQQQKDNLKDSRKETRKLSSLSIEHWMMIDLKRFQVQL